MSTPALHLDLLPVAWLVGTWTGDGFLVERAAEGEQADAGAVVEVPVTLELTFRHTGSAVLGYALRVTRHGVEEDGEVGWWRVRPHEQDLARVHLEVLLAHPTGVVEVYVGEAADATIHLATDLVAHTETGAPVAAASRQYGIRANTLVFVVDEATGEAGLRSRLSGQLERVPGTGWDGISQG
ncbi:MAG TPA: FABP family protein [Mycobacteriales bacterium]|nr:FABP family protein [Mycobacteriales bacterium]